jgi:TolA-binding protein
MAKHTEDNPELIVDLEETVSKTEQYIEENKNSLTIIVSVIVGIIAIYFGYTNMYLAPMEQEAKENMWKAEQYFEADSFNLALNGDGNQFGFLQIIDNYGASSSGNLANYYAGVSYLKLGQYQTAIDYLSSFDGSDKIVGPVATGAIGDAYMELGNTSDALNQYKAAANQSDNNFTSPMFLMKAGFAAEQLGQKDDAIAMYKKIQKNYPASTESRNIEKYLARLGAI